MSARIHFLTEIFVRMCHEDIKRSPQGHPRVTLGAGREATATPLSACSWYDVGSDMSPCPSPTSDFEETVCALVRQILVHKGDDPVMDDA